MEVGNELDNGAVIFSEISNDVISLVPQQDTQNSKHTSDVQTGTDVIECKETGTDSIAITDEATQTEFISNESSDDDEALSEWLKKILPLVEEELAMGITKLLDWAPNGNGSIDISKYQTIGLIENPETEDIKNSDELIDTGNCAITWLSLSTEIYPFVAISYHTTHSSWCEHKNPVVQIFGPQTEHSKKYYKQFTKISVNSCVTNLSTNFFNKDIFVGSSISGDLYVWLYNTSLNEIKELFCESYQCGSVIGFVWMKNNSISLEVNLLSCHQDGSIILWKIGKVITKDKIFKINSREKSSIELTTAIGLSGSEFVVGSNDGKLFLCSASQLLPIRGQTNLFDPVMNELEPHKFAISSLVLTNLNDKRLLVSCDMSGEVFFHDIESSKIQDSKPVIMKLPLPFKNRIVCTKNALHILSPGINGILEIYRIDNGELTQLDGDLKGKGNLISISNTGHLLFTGVYNTELQLYTITSN